MFENEWFPQANAMGVTWQEFWKMNPHIIKCLIKGHREKIEQEIKRQDLLQYLWWGNYGLSAVAVAVEHTIFGKKAKSEYVKEAILSKAFENEEQTYERELKKALLAEEQWIIAGKQRGLPETII